MPLCVRKKDDLRRAVDRAECVAFDALGSEQIGRIEIPLRANGRGGLRAFIRTAQALLWFIALTARPFRLIPPR